MVSTGPQFTTPDAYLRTIYEQFEKNLDNSIEIIVPLVQFEAAEHLNNHTAEANLATLI